MKEHRGEKLHIKSIGIALAVLSLCLNILFSMPVRTQAASLELGSLSGLKSSEMAGIAEAKLGFVLNEPDFSGVDWKQNYTDSDFKYLACVIYCETEPLGYEARVALGNVVLNRMNSSTDWGHVNTIKDVIYDTKWGRQFDCTSGKVSMMDKAYPIFDAVLEGNTDAYKAWQIRGMTECMEVAKDVMRGYKTVPDSFVFCRGGKYIETDKASCMESGRLYRIIESHIYYEN